MSGPIHTEQEGRDTIVLAEQRLPRPIDEVFAFFSDARNLERITPALIRFRIVTPAPIEMRIGTLIDYRMRIRGVPVKWKTRIAEWDPPHRFADEQLRGPYRLWYHTHTFEADNGGTVIGDRIVYRPKGGALVNALFVKHDVRAIFAYRRQVLSELFAEGTAT